MVDKMGPDSAKSPELNLKELNGALANAAKANPAAAAAVGVSPGGVAGGGADLMTDAVITAAVNPVASAFVSIADGVGGGNKDMKNGKKPEPRSIFVSGGQKAQTVARPAVTSLMPKEAMTYKERLAMAKHGQKMGGSASGTDASGNLFAATRLASMSLTGKDSGGGAAPGAKGGGDGLPKGMSASGMTAATQQLTGLMKQISITLNTMEGSNRYNSKKRLQNDLRQGNAQAEQLVDSSPKMARKAGLVGASA
jgi:hypothetical protein